MTFFGGELGTLRARRSHRASARSRGSCRYPADREVLSRLAENVHGGAAPAPRGFSFLCFSTLMSFSFSLFMRLGVKPGTGMAMCQPVSAAELGACVASAWRIA